MTLPQVLRFPGHALTTGATSPSPLAHLRAALALHFEGVLTRRECVDYTRGVYAGRSAWVPNFDGVQFTLGRAYYVHLETGREDEYFAEAAASDAAVDRFTPGLADRMLAILRLCVGAEVGRRPGFCGPGVHVFPAGEHVSHHGGEVHWDIEGLGDDEVAAHADAVTAVLMLQPAAQGGGLRVWDRRLRGRGQRGGARLGPERGDRLRRGRPGGPRQLPPAPNLRVQRAARPDLGDGARRADRGGVAGLVLSTPRRLSGRPS